MNAGIEKIATHDLPSTPSGFGKLGSTWKQGYDGLTPEQLERLQAQQPAEGEGVH